MIAELSFPVRHLSVRVPWHDNDWDGTVCGDPKSNTACLKLSRIAERKDETSEAGLSGYHFKDLRPEEVPPCLQESAAFMSPHSLVRKHSHPYRRDDSGAHGHFRPTPLNYPAYSAPGMPFRWMLKESFRRNAVSGLREHYPLDDVNEDLEPHPWLQFGLVARLQKPYSYP